MRTSWRRTFVAHLQTWRPYTLCYPGLVGLAGVVLASDSATPRQWLVSWAVPTLVWLAAHYLGDFFDRHLDAIGKPQRPIPSGRLSPQAAVVTGTACATSAVVVGTVVNGRGVLFVFAAVAGTVAYSMALKGRGLSGNIARGMLTAMVLVYAAVQVDPSPPLQVWLLAAMFLLHDTASNLVGTLRDVDNDRDGRYQTFSVRHGVRAAARTAALFYAAAVMVGAVSSWVQPRHAPAFFVMLAAAAVIGGSAFVLVLRKHSQVDALRAHKVLVAERLVLAGAVFTFGAGLLPTLVVVAVALAISLPVQAGMRTRYELPPLVESSDAERGKAIVSGNSTNC